MTKLSVIHPINRPSLFILISAGFALIAALLCMIGWFGHIAPLIQIRSDYSPMKFNAAVSLFLAGAAFLLLEYQPPRHAAFAALLGLTLPALTLAEYLTDGNFGIDNLFVTPFTETRVHFAGRMAPNTAVALTLIHLAVFYYAVAAPIKQAGELFLVFTGSIVFALGIVPLIGYAGNIESAHTWGNYTGMSLMTAICVVLLGGSIIAAVWKTAPRLPFWLGVPVGIFFLIIALSIWLAVRGYEDIRFEESLQLETGYISGRANDRLTAFYAAIERMAIRWDAENGTPRNVWEKDAQAYLKAYPFLRTLEWVNRDSYLQWAVPPDDVDKLTGIKLNTEGTRAGTYQQVLETQEPQVTKAIDLEQGGVGFLYMCPIHANDQTDGIIVAAFDLNQVFTRILQREKNGPFYLTVTEDDRVVFTNAPDDYVPPERWTKSSIMQNKTNNWIVSVSPAADMLAQKNSPLQLLVLVIGLITAVLATFFVMLAIRSQAARDHARVNEERMRKIIDTHAILTSANFDVRLFMNSVVQHVLTITPATGAVIEMIDGDEMVYIAASGTVSPYEGFRIKRAGSLSGLCVAEGQMMISRDTRVDPRVDAEACRKVGASSMVVFPLFQRGQIVGVLKALSSTYDAFGNNDQNVLKLLVGLLGGALGQQMEIERRERLEEQLRHLAQNDSLTGLPNRMLFQDRLSHAIETSHRTGHLLAVMYMDIDKFKNVNDVFGHAVGDTLLQAFAARVTHTLRKGDTLARLGGDEFTLIAENLKAPSDAEMIARKIVEAAREPFPLPTMTLHVSVSIGVTIVTHETGSASQILEQADEALYEAKKAGRNGYKLMQMPDALD